MSTFTRGLAHAALALIIAAAGCSESSSPVNPDPGPEPGPDPAQADVEGTLGDFSAWQAVSPPVTESTDGMIGDRDGRGSFLSGDDARYNPQAVCVATPHTLAKNPAEIITLAPGGGLLIPGVLVQGRSHVLGSLTQLVIDERAPVDLIIDEAAASTPTRTVEAPDRAGLRDGVNALIQDAETSGFEGSTSVFFDKVTSYSREQAALAFNFSARYLDAEARGSLETRTSGSETTVTAGFIQRAFTIDADPPAFVDEWFTSDLTEDRLNRYIDTGQMGPDNPPLYVQSVTYGRIVMVNFTSSESREDIEAFFEAGYSNRVGELSADVRAQYDEMIRNASIEVVSLGGPAGDAFEFAAEVLSPGEEGVAGLEEFFSQDVPLTSFVPISYVLADLRTNEIAYVGETSSHEVLDCSGRAGSDFESGGEGWTGENTRGGSDPLTAIPFTGRAPSPGNRDGDWSFRSLDGNAATAYLQAPDTYLGDKAVYADGELTYWTWLNCVSEVTIVTGTSYLPVPCDGRSYGTISSATSPAVIIRGVDSQKILVGSFTTDAFTPEVWQQRTVSLAPGTLRVYNETLGQNLGDAGPATEADVLEVLSNIASLSIRAELASSELDFVYIDDIRLTPPAAPLN